MEKWNMLEKNCYAYLSDNYANLISTKAFGESDSTKPDIEVKTKHNKTFFVEVKSASAQCCQFVLFPNEETQSFDFSRGNIAPKTNNCDAIISYMDNHFDKYKKVNQAGIPIEIDKSILYGLVNDFYSPKGVKYFMTKASSYIIFPIESFSDYFDISAYYRRKKSGSSEPIENKNLEEIKNGISREKLQGLIEFKSVGKKTRCFFHTSANINENRLICPEYTYQFKDNDHSKKVDRKDSFVYEIRRLSNTNNPNVICQLSLKKDFQDNEDLKKFESEIKS